MSRFRFSMTDTLPYRLATLSKTTFAIFAVQKQMICLTFTGRNRHFVRSEAFRVSDYQRMSKVTSKNSSAPTALTGSFRDKDAGVSRVDFEFQIGTRSTDSNIVPDVLNRLTTPLLWKGNGN